MDDIFKSVADGAGTGETAELVLGLPGEEQETLIQAIGSLKSEHAARFLSLLYPSLADKRLQKPVKRALFRLKTQGIPVEEPKIPGESVLRKVETGREARAFLSNYDPEMTRVVLVAFEMKKNQFLLSQAVLHFSDGLMELKSFSIARDELEDFLKDYVSQMPPSMVLPAISAAYAGYLIEEASGMSGREAEEAAELPPYACGNEERRRKAQRHLSAGGGGYCPRLRPRPFSPTGYSSPFRSDGRAWRKTGRS